MKFSTRGIVLSKESFGEADSYIQFLTRDWGVITLLAKSAKKSKRRYVGGLDLFCHDELFVRGEIKEKGYLQELSVLNSFSGIRENLERVLVAGRAIQWVKRLANMGGPLPGIYRLMGQTLALIEKENDLPRLELLTLIFRIKLLSQLGMKPRTEACARCSESVEADAGFDLSSGGIVCRNCLRTTNWDHSLHLEKIERSLLHEGEDIRLSQWPEVQFPHEMTNHLNRLLTQFASFHTHIRLPI